MNKNPDKLSFLASTYTCTYISFAKCRECSKSPAFLFTGILVHSRAFGHGYNMVTYNKDTRSNFCLQFSNGK